MSFPWMGYYFFRLALCMQANWDIAIVCTVAAGLNFLQSRQRPYWHAYQVAVMAVMAAHVYGPGWGWPPLEELAASAVATATSGAASSLRLLGGSAATTSGALFGDIRSAL